MIVNYQLLAADALRILYKEILVRGSIEPCQKVNNFLGKEGNEYVTNITKKITMNTPIFISKFDY